jgi:thioredoxin 1
MSTAALFAIAVLLHLQAPANSARPPGHAENKSQPALTILFFTASWCEPCRAVSPMLEKFARKNEKRVQLVTVDFDRAKAEVERWGVREIPVVIVLSSQGRVLLRCEGTEQQALSALATELENLLKKAKEGR